MFRGVLGESSHALTKSLWNSFEASKNGHWRQWLVHSKRAGTSPNCGGKDAFPSARVWRNLCNKAPRLQGKIRGKLSVFGHNKKLVLLDSALKDKVARPTFGWIKPVPWDQCSWKFGCVFQPREIRYDPWSWSWPIYLYMLQMICMVN